MLFLERGTYFASHHMYKLGAHWRKHNAGISYSKSTVSCDSKPKRLTSDCDRRYFKEYYFYSGEK